MVDSWDPRKAILLPGTREGREGKVIGTFKKMYRPGFEFVDATAAANFMVLTSMSSCVIIAGTRRWRRRVIKKCLLDGHQFFDLLIFSNSLHNTSKPIRKYCLYILFSSVSFVVHAKRNSNGQGKFTSHD
jgi:hypothetical protein